MHVVLFISVPYAIYVNEKTFNTNGIFNESMIMKHTYLNYFQRVFLIYEINAVGVEL